jgi:hypothetical protein
MRESNHSRFVRGCFGLLPGNAAIPLRGLVAFLMALSLLTEPVFAFYTPLSDEAVREAYFLGQRRDESMATFLAKYIHELPPPDFGPHIASITTYTPFAQAVLWSSQQTANYSAQRAQIDHRRQTEIVQILVAIRFTDSYGPFIRSASSSSRDRNPVTAPRPSDFWRDFNVAVLSDDKSLEPASYDGHPDYVCSDGGCYLIGATIQLEFPAESFPSQNITVQVEPPDADLVFADFDLSLLR